LSAELKLKREESSGVCYIEKGEESRVAVELTRLVEGGVECGR
jgi:hypothetical protein